MTLIDQIRQTLSGENKIAKRVCVLQLIQKTRVLIKEFHDADGNDDPDQVGDHTDQNQISCPLYSHCPQINCQDIEGRFRASHDDRRNPGAQGIGTACFYDICEYAQRSAY